MSLANKIKLFNILDTKELDAIFLFSPIYLKYFLNFSGDNGLLFLNGQDSLFATDSRYTLQAEKENIDNVIEMKNHLSIVREIIDKYKIKKIGFDGGNVFYSFIFKIINNTDASWVDISNELSKIRAIKNSEEIDYIKQSVSIQEKGLSNIIEQGVYGLSENFFSVQLECELKRLGAEELSFPIIAAVDEDAALPHAIPNNKKIILKDSVLLVDWGVKFNGYCSDQTVTLDFNKKNIDFNKIYDIVKEAQKLAMDFIKPGVKASDLDSIARDYIESFGYGDYFGHSLGHGVGLEIHEYPFISPFSDSIIEENMVFTVEPGIYIPGKYGVRLEDMVLVKKNGIERLTTIDK